MQVGSDSSLQLTYCTNIHPGNGWDEVFGELQKYAPALKARLAPTSPFGIGLRLSGVESRELLQGDRLRSFKDWLDEHGLYVYTLNGFPYGPFHKQPVKADVHAPDWRDEERVAYTLRLIEILAYLLPDGMDGGISTSPLSYKRWVDSRDAATWDLLTRNVTRVAEALVQVRQHQGKLLHLDIEPEPDGLLENSSELVRFFQDCLLTSGARTLAQSLGVSIEQARAYLLEHIRVCFDTCHVAVAYEEPAEVLDHFAEVGIQVGKVQVSSALKVNLPHHAPDRISIERALRPFAESTYLHQVIQRNYDGTSDRFPDLLDALPEIYAPRAAEWRVHFHVPIFIERFADFGSTQDTILRTFELLRERRFTRHLEIETYTWGVLPPDLKLDLDKSIGREYEWVLHVLG